VRVRGIGRRIFFAMRKIFRHPDMGLSLIDGNEMRGSS